MGDTTRATAARRLKVAPELLADVRLRYETTDESIASMAADLGCCTRTVHNLARHEGWVRYVAPPRDLSPAAKLAARAKALSDQERSPPPDPPSQALPPSRSRASADSSPSKLAKRAETGRQVDLPPPGGGEEKITETAEQLHRELQSLLAVVAAARERMKQQGYGKNELREAAQVIANLTTALRRLHPLLCAVPQVGANADYDDMPADLDEFREALARKIEAFMESRGDEADAFEIDADGDAAAQS